VAAFVITRIQTGDYDRWRPMFDQDQPRAREKAQTQQVLRNVDDRNEVFIYLEYESLEDATEARERLVGSGVLDRFEDKHGPTVLLDDNNIEHAKSAAQGLKLGKLPAAPRPVDFK
jgi:hypothetical protein